LSADGQSAEEAAKVTRRYEPLHAATPQRPSVAPKPAKPAAKHAAPAVKGAAKHAAAEVTEAGGVAATADKGRRSSARAQAQQRKALEAGTESAAGSE
jgi:hypothetical protein